ncbi:MAG: glycosyl hydrolase, partial [Kiritimatiellaeota bacterium]|nr:glycosyl hydrolase [Kiritimatiellota bacterium]
MQRLFLIVVGVLAVAAVQAEDIVRVGAGSYTTRAPAGAKLPPAEISRTAAVRGPMPSNKWWSSLAWERLSDAMYPHPLAVRAVAGGLRVCYPGPNITASKSAIMGAMPGGADDFVIGVAGAKTFEEARVDGFSDWFVTALFESGGKQLRTSFGHGSPFVFITVAGGNPTLTFRQAPKIWSGSARDAVLGVTIQNRHYGVFAPTGSTWSDLGAPSWTADTKGKTYFAVAVLPDDQPETLALFHRHAYTHVTDTRVAWQFDEAHAAVRTTFTFTTKNHEGQETGTLFTLYPHQWLHTKTTLLDKSYASVRGPLKLGAGNSFATEMIFPGVLPSLPLTPNMDRSKLSSLIDAEASLPGKRVADTYWLGKQLGKWATLLPLAEQSGNTPAVAALTAQARDEMENFFTATGAQGAPKQKADGVFFHDANWGTLIGYPASYGSDDQLNDHHFHYGYFIRA